MMGSAQKQFCPPPNRIRFLCPARPPSPLKTLCERKRPLLLLPFFVFFLDRFFLSIFPH